MKYSIYCILSLYLLIITCGLHTNSISANTIDTSVSGQALTEISEDETNDYGCEIEYIKASDSKNDEEKTAIQNGLKRNSNGDLYYYVKGKAIRNQWKRIEGKRYYFKKDGMAAIGSCKIKKKYYVFDEKGRLFTPRKLSVLQVKNDKYCVKSTGLAQKGWKYIKGKVYYADKSGKCASGKRVSYIDFTEKGYAKITEQAMAKILARKFINKHCTKDMSQREKFKKCFHIIMACTSYVGDWRPDGFGKKYWQYRAAVSMFQSDLVGCCYGIASVVAAVAKELGYQPYVIWASEAHAFVKIDGKYYDNMYGALFGASSRPHYTLKEKFKF